MKMEREKILKCVSVCALVGRFNGSWESVFCVIGKRRIFAAEWVLGK